MASTAPRYSLAELVSSIAHGLFRRLDLDPGGLSGPGDTEADGCAPEPADHHGLDAVAHAPDVLDLRHDADPRIPTVHPGHREQERVVTLGGGADGRPSLVGLDGERHHHPRQDDAGGQGQQGQGLDIELVHVFSPFHAHTERVCPR